MQYSEFRDLIMKCATTWSEQNNWRLGQAVYNLLDSVVIGRIGRIAKEKEGVDCFYDDKKIEDFIKASFKYYKKH